MQNSKLKSQMEAIKYIRKYNRITEDYIEFQRVDEKERSRKAYISFIEKARQSQENHDVLLRNQKAKYAETDEQLNIFYGKMNKCISAFNIFLAEKIALKKKQEVSRAASALLKRLNNAYLKGIKTRELSPEKAEKIIKKYEKIAEISQKKIEDKKEINKNRRDFYIKNNSKLEDARYLLERMEEERKHNVSRLIEEKDIKAQNNKMQIYEERRGVTEMHNKKLQDAKKKKETLKLELDEYRRNIKEKEYIKDQQLAKIKEKQEQVEEMKKKMLKTGTDNPYIIFERNITSTSSKIRHKRIKSQNINNTLPVYH